MAYSTISTIFNGEYIDEEDSYKGTDIKQVYCVDDSSFIPLSEIVKNSGKRAVGDLNKSLVYDFIDGKDTGISVPVGRSYTKTDIAEISVELGNTSDEVKKQSAEINADSAFRESLNGSFGAE